MRTATAIKKSRGGNLNPQGKRERQNEKNARICEFQKKSGIRRNELKQLRRNDFTYDESGCFCIKVRSGKGGKYQEQRPAAQFEEYLRPFFDGSGRFVFDRKELKNKIDFQWMRRELAQKTYDECFAAITENPEVEQQMQHEIIERYKKYNIKYLQSGKNPRVLAGFIHEMQGTYHLRCTCRQLAKEKRLPLSYNKTALMYVSVFVLSHWRTEVTVKHYCL